MSRFQVGLRISEGAPNDSRNRRICSERSDKEKCARVDGIMLGQTNKTLLPNLLRREFLSVYLHLRFLRIALESDHSRIY